MKKLLITLFALLWVGSAHAGTITLNTYVSNNDLSVANFEADNNSLENTINGDIEGGVNIKAQSLVSADFANAVNPVVRWGESFNDYTASGMLPATASGLTSDISAGTSYVNGIRIVKSATSNTYTASKNTFVYVTQDETYSFCEETTVTEVCSSAPANSLLLAKVVTDGSDITSVDDQRTTAIQFETASTNFPSSYRDGMFVSRDSTTEFHTEPGSLAIGDVIYTRTSDSSTLTLSTDADWIETDAGNEDDIIYVYAYNNAGTTWDIKFSSNDPAYSDTSDNTGGLLRYYKVGTDYYRAIAWAYLSSDAVQIYNYSNFRDVGVPSFVTREAISNKSSGSAAYVAIPETRIDFYSDGLPIRINSHIPTDGAGVYVQSFVDGVGAGMATSENVAAGSGIHDTNMIKTFSQGDHYIELRWKTSGTAETGSSGDQTDGGRNLVLEFMK